MATPTNVKPGIAELARNVNLNMVRTAARKGLSLSAYLERENPTVSSDKSGLDAFQRILKELDIRVNAVPAAGTRASTWDEAFDGDEYRKVLGHEWGKRVWRSAMTGQSSSVKGFQDVSVRETLASTDLPIGSFFRPDNIDPGTRGRYPIVPQIPAEAFISSTRSINGESYQVARLVPIDNDQVRLRKVNELSEMPGTTLSMSSERVALTKYGRKLVASYESLRRIELDRIARLIERMASAALVDRAETAADVLVNGDGTAGSASPVVQLNQLDATIGSTYTPESVTMRSWLALKHKFANPWVMTTLVGNYDSILPLLLLESENGGLVFNQTSAAQGFGSFTVMNPSLNTGVRVGIMDSLAADSWLVFDDRVAVERVTESGSEISEFDRVITNQSEVLTFSETEGFNRIELGTSFVVDLRS